jgi:A/G-specific adenine glycosylase
MDLGATVCKPRSPLCDICPLAEACQARAGGAPETYPRKLKKAERPRRYGVAYLITRGDQVGLVRRPPKGLLGGMLALPTSDWRTEIWEDEAARDAAPVVLGWRDVGEIEHVFTHFSLTLKVLVAAGEAPDLIWSPLSDLEALPSVFLKAARLGLSRFL